MDKKRVVILGGGPGGYTAAFLAADLGMNVSLIDENPQPGGVCLHRGCIPSKALLHLAKLYGVVEIKSYARSAKRLTISQLELLLIKNHIKLPINRSSDKAIAKKELKENTITNIYLSFFFIKLTHS